MDLDLNNVFESVSPVDAYYANKVDEVVLTPEQLAEMERQRQEKIRIFNDKNAYLVSDDLRYGYGADMHELDLGRFFDAIFNKEDVSPAYDFEAVQSYEYRVWKDQSDEGVTDIPYKDLYSIWRYNPIVVYREKKNGKVTNKHKLVLKDDEEAMQFLEGRQFAIAAPITYVGRNRNSENARFLFAFAIDLDGVGVQQLRNLFLQQTVIPEGTTRPHVPKPNIIVNSGGGLHLYYLLKEPVPIFRENVNSLNRLKECLTSKAWNEGTSPLDAQFQGIFQPFRLPGTLTKFGVPIRAFQNLDAPYYTLSDLNHSFEPGDEPLKDEEIKRLERGGRKQATMTLKAAEELYPEWYEKVVINGDKMPKKWQIKNDLYEWWLRQLRSDLREKQVKVGHRFFCILVLAIFASKCESISKERLLKDAKSLLPKFDWLTEKEDNHFTMEDVMDAVQGYKMEHITFPKKTLEKLSGFTFPSNRRNGRKQNVHVKMMSMIRDNISHPDGKWREGNGRKKGSKVSASKSPAAKVVKEWQKANPNGTKTQCASDSGLDRKTVAKWWGSELSPQNLVLKWKITHPGNDNKSQCAKDTGLSRPTVIKWWE